MKTTAILIWLGSATAALAHSGHDAALPAGSAAHWLLSPAHGLGALGMAALAYVLWDCRRARRRDRGRAR